ncbi:MAG TPA: dihydrolipoamide acetyltransferase family protein [Roseomonas sp.]|nr:dihydrolipoamide acetyltransferase family protein [Roseomonas sp.]
MSIFRLPDLGEGLQEAEIVAWHVAAGDHVVADQPLVSVETEKAVVELPSPRAGQVARLCAEPGARVAVGAPLVEFAEGAAPDAGGIVGTLPQAEAPARRQVAAMPAARAKATQLGLDLAGLAGSGPGGTITLADVEAAAGAAPQDFTPLRGVRLAMARSMAASRDSVSPATLCDDADVQDWPEDADHTMRLVRAVVAGCRAEPALNAAFDGERLARRLEQQVSVGIAVETEAGLFVPVLRDAGRRGAAELRADFEGLKRGLADRSIAAEALRGATITLSNFGALGGRYAALSIVPPQVAILGAGRIAARPAVHGGALAIRRLLPLSLSFDHRAVTGAEAARFLAAVIADLQQPG